MREQLTRGHKEKRARKEKHKIMSMNPEAQEDNGKVWQETRLPARLRQETDPRIEFRGSEGKK